MMIEDLFSQTASAWLAAPEARTGSVSAPAGVDVSGYIGPTLAVDAAFVGITTGTTKTLDVAFEHNDVPDAADAGWAAVPADALIDASGAPATVEQIKTTASKQRLGLKKERLKRYVRATLTCGSTNVEHTGAVLLAGATRYANFT